MAKAAKNTSKKQSKGNAVKSKKKPAGIFADKPVTAKKQRG
jgi:hypothetical protein